MPKRYASAWSSQKPLFSQNMQKWFPSTKSMSMMFRRYSLSSAVSFSTTAPSATVWTQAAWMRPFTRTEQTRQLPWGTRSL